jgi:hypothetical protein
MKKLSETYKELGIAFTFPIEIKDAKGNETYHEDSDDYWHRCEYDAKGNMTYFENYSGFKRGTPKSSKTCSAKMVIRFTPIDGYTPFIAEYLKGAETLETRPAR